MAINRTSTEHYVNWFIKQQGEEERNFADQITKMELFSDVARSLYMLSSELAASITLPMLLPCRIWKKRRNRTETAVRGRFFRLLFILNEKTFPGLTRQMGGAIIIMVSSR